jgi:hypothetical protein
MSTAVAGTTSIRPTATYTTLWDATDRISAEGGVGFLIGCLLCSPLTAFLSGDVR